MLVYEEVKPIATRSLDDIILYRPILARYSAFNL